MPVEEDARHGKLRTLDGFQVTEVLNEDPQSKYIAVLGSFGGKPEPAIVLMWRKAFDKARVASLVSEATTLELDFNNDIYSKYVGVPPPDHATISVDVIYPATDTHVRKYRAQRRLVVAESPEVYERVVLPYIRAIPPASIQWVYNVLEKKKEVERLLFEDPDPQQGFMLHPDMKWDQTSADQLYCLAIVHRRDLACVRDLHVDHIPLLENIRDKGAKALEERYGVGPSSLRIFLHYPPSYYHLHVHFVHVSLVQPGALAGKALLLDDVIDNLRTFGTDFYERKTLTYVLGEEDRLWKLLAPTANAASGAGEAAGAGAAGAGAGV